MTRIHKEARNEEEIGAPSKNNISAYNTREPEGFFRAQGRCLSQRYTHTHTVFGLLLPCSPGSVCRWHVLVWLLFTCPSSVFLINSAGAITKVFFFSPQRRMTSVFHSFFFFVFKTHAIIILIYILKKQCAYEWNVCADRRSWAVSIELVVPHKRWR